MGIIINHVWEEKKSTSSERVREKIKRNKSKRMYVL